MVKSKLIKFEIKVDISVCKCENSYFGKEEFDGGWCKVVELGLIVRGRGERK